MATHASYNNLTGEAIDFKGGSKLIGLGAVVAVLGLGGAIGLGKGGEFAFRPFLFGYLAAYMFVLSLALGALSFVLLQHLVKGGWGVSVRRTAENLAGTLPMLAIFSLPLLWSVYSGNGYLYRWALPIDKAQPGAVEAAAKGESELPETIVASGTAAEPTHLIPRSSDEEVLRAIGSVAAPSDPSKLRLDPLTLMKRSHGLYWLNPGFFIFRIVFYFACWIGIVKWFRGLSIQQDQTGDPNISLRMQKRAAPALVILALTVTGAAFDLVMSLDPHWYSTMFGVCYIANCFIGSYAIIIITVFLLQAFGYLRVSVTTEHYHDLGKYLFAFTFFYGYVAFSQFMLMWYANLPEEVSWFARHGASTAILNGWNKVVLAVLFGHILIPFAALLSRHVKRHPSVLVLLAAWQLVFVLIDMYWLVMPEMGPTRPGRMTVVITSAAAVGLMGAFVAAYGFLASKANLRPSRDPRLGQSVVFQNI